VAVLACLIGVAGASIAPAAAENSKPLRVGILPTNSTPVILRMYQPMRSFLESELKREVILETATSYRAFYNDTGHGVFDVVVTAPHLARLHQIDGGLHTLAMNDSRSKTVVVVHHDSDVHDARGLRGGVIALHDPASTSAIQGIAWLRQEGLQAGRDYRTIHLPTQTSTVLAVIEGRATAGVVTSAGLTQLPVAAVHKVHVLRGIGPLSGLVYVAGPQVDQAQRQTLAAALLKFPNNEPLWSQFAGASGYGRIMAVDDAKLRKMDPLLPATRRALAVEPDHAAPGSL
jgi:phosphonate transport system substrate-binding protein